MRTDVPNTKDVDMYHARKYLRKINFLLIHLLLDNLDVIVSAIKHYVVARLSFLSCKVNVIKPRLRPACVGFALTATWLAFATSLGHTQESGTGRADPGEIERRIEQIRPRPPAEPAPDLPPAPGVRPEVRAEPELTIVLTGVVVEGATAFTADQLGPLYAEFLARTVTRADLEDIATRITQAYLDAGYFISRAVVPPQEVEAGVLRVRVIEGYVAEVRVRGGEGQSALLDGYASAIAEQRPARLETVERTLLLINGLPGFQVLDVGLEPQDDEGAYVMDIEVGYDWAEGLANLDNRGTPEVGRLQAFLSGSANSLAGLGERLQVGVATVPDEPEELLYGQIAYEQPIWRDGTVLGGYLAVSRIDAGGDLAQEDTEGRGLDVRATVRHPLILTRGQTLYLRGSLELHEIKEDRFGQSNFDDSLRVARMRADYAARDDWRGTNLLGLEISQGLDVLDASDEGDARLSRPDGEAAFTKVRADAVRLQEIWDRISLRLATQGQVALDPLLSFEEFLLGGTQFGRAYDFGEVSGEDGVAGSVELRFGEELDDGLMSSYQIYGFYDVGAVWNRNVEGDARESLASAGGGVRLGLLEDVQATLEVAKPLTRSVESTGDKAPRVFFSVTARF